MGILKQNVKRYLLRKRGIFLDNQSVINRNVITSSEFQKCRLVDSKLHITRMGDNCFFEHVYAYGDIELGSHISISGPGTVLHAEKGKIKIGSFTSIAPNVTITEFNHNIKKATTYGMKSNIYGGDFKDDVITKGDINIGEDVWIGSNVTITSGVTIGRGAVIGGGGVVTSDVPKYAIVGGVPAKVIKMRFSDEQIKKLESSRWWEWDRKQLFANRSFFEDEV